MMSIPGGHPWIQGVAGKCRLSLGSHLPVTTPCTRTCPKGQLLQGGDHCPFIPHYTHSTGLVQKRCPLNISRKNEHMNDGMAALFFCIFQKIDPGLLLNCNTDQLHYSNLIYNSAVAYGSMLKTT